MKKAGLLGMVLLMAIMAFAHKKGKHVNHHTFGTEAVPGKIEYKQPDGTTISIFLKGNRAVNWATTLDGYTLLKGPKGGFYYADSDNGLFRTGMLAHNQDKRNEKEIGFVKNLPKGLNFTPAQVNALNSNYLKNSAAAGESAKAAFPTKGQRKLIAILVGFKDVPFGYSNEEFNKMFNQANYTENGATGSVYDFFHDNSFGELELITEVAGPYTISENREFYGGDDENGNDKNTRAMVGEAVIMADNDVDFSQFDNDGDGDVDGVYIIFAGYGEEAGGPSEAIWSHKFSLANQIRVDGVNVTKYSCSPELRGNNGNSRTHIGVICHEFGHVLGLPDYYDVDYGESGGQSFDIGNWDIMAGGSWNNGGASPPYYNSYSRFLLDWQNLDTITQPGSYILGSNHQYNQAYYIPTKTENEFFILENRQKEKWDAFIPGHGMLIFHVDRNNGGWLYNRINVSPENQGFDLIEADNSKTEGSVTSDPFPGTSNVNKFTDTSNPNALSKNGTPTEIPITNIREDKKQGIIYFDVLGGMEPEVKNFTAIPNGLGAVNLNWQNKQAKNVVVAKGGKPFLGKLPLDVAVGNTLNDGNEVLYKGQGEDLENGDNNPEVFYSLWAEKEGMFQFLDYAHILMPDSAGPGEEFIYDFEVFHDGWGLYSEGGKNWQEWDVGSFFQGISGRGNFAHVNSDYFGENGIQNTSLLSPVYYYKKGNISTLKIEFDHYYKHISGGRAGFYYSVDNGASWQLLQEWSSTTGSKTQPLRSEFDVSAIANDNSSIQFKWNYKAEYGFFWCVDSVKVTKHLVTGIDGFNAFEPFVQVYPNPAKNYLNINSTEGAEIRIIDLNGGVHFVGALQKGVSNLDISKLGPGAYLAVFRTEKNQVVKKFIKK